MNTHIHPFSPILDQHTKILFLGSFPSIASFEHSFYYAHARNAFWPIMETIFNIKLTDNEIKKAFCLEHGIGLWDAIASCQRSNSSDTNLKMCVPNDLKKLLTDYPNIHVLAFTGKKGYDLFNRYFKDLSVETVLLPSTSPAHAAMTREEKVKKYKEVLVHYGI